MLHLRRLMANPRFIRRFAAGAGAAAAGGGIMSIPARAPLTFGATFTSAKTTVADLFVQKVIEKREKIDYQRTAVFAIFGFVYMGVAQYFLYVKLMAETWFPRAGEYAAKSFAEKARDVVGTRNLFAQVAIDQLVHIPFIFYPCYYTTKELIMGNTEGSVPELVMNALYKWRKNLWEDTKASWTIWIPCNFVNFGLMPMHMRIPFMACCSMVFCVVLSLMRGGEPKLNKEATELVKAIKEDLKTLDHVKFVELIRKTHKAHAKKSTEAMDYKEFLEVMAKIGVRDPKVTEALFKCADTDRNGGIDVSELSALLFVLAGADQAVNSKEQAVRVFESCDIDGNGEITFTELVDMLYGIMTVREKLLINGGDISPEQSMDSIASAGGKAKHLVELPAAELERARLEQLRQMHSRFRGPEGKDTTLQQILRYDSEKLAEKIIEEADSEEVDGVLTEKEFTKWLTTDSPATSELLKLFDATIPS